MWNENSFSSREKERRILSLKGEEGKGNRGETTYLNLSPLFIGQREGNHEGIMNIINKIKEGEEWEIG